eukprot:CAMPEP_0113553022 /NCGR_PEP_ID=MMETSP0015_2-20120614/15382_1 /TAXON_ID=2838 /ORGANISM="Odontella" /LENGTH=291 /DNA_ID=CAMNT_0000454045 /DNA_START=121 /DNA_END=996 /DNA_ORIENTATION=- /assembly_acc=CAM_ASM_000160
MVASLAVPSVPVLFWWKSAVDDRAKRAEDVKTKIRIPSVQTIDDLMVEKCKPGDVLLFDRRCHKCASGPMASFSCLVARGLLCGEDKGATRSVETGKFDHCGVVVPGDTATKAQAADPSNLLLLEATASEGIVARPLLTRLEMSQSRTVLLLPISSPGERRNDEEFEPSKKTARLQQRLVTNLTAFRSKWVEESKKQNYAGGHPTLGVFGALGYAMNLQKTSPAPVSPSAWLVVSALQDAGAAENISARSALETRVDDFLRDHRFNEKDTVRLRPGWKFLAPVVVREMSRS